MQSIQGVEISSLLGRLPFPLPQCYFLFNFPNLFSFTLSFRHGRSLFTGCISSVSGIKIAISFTLSWILKKKSGVLGSKKQSSGRKKREIFFFTGSILCPCHWKCWKRISTGSPTYPTDDPISQGTELNIYGCFNFFLMFFSWTCQLSGCVSWTESHSTLSTNRTTAWWSTFPSSQSPFTWCTPPSFHRASPFLTYSLRWVRVYVDFDAMKEKVNLNFREK